jgi:hypothetical protein
MCWSFPNFNCLLLLFTSSISAILSGTIGIHYGHVLILFKVTYFTLCYCYMQIIKIYFTNTTYF